MVIIVLLLYTQQWTLEKKEYAEIVSIVAILTFTTTNATENEIAKIS